MSQTSSTFILDPLWVMLKAHSVQLLHAHSVPSEDTIDARRAYTVDSCKIHIACLQWLLAVFHTVWCFSSDSLLVRMNIGVLPWTVESFTMTLKHLGQNMKEIYRSQHSVPRSDLNKMVCLCVWVYAWLLQAALWSTHELTVETYIIRTIQMHVNVLSLPICVITPHSATAVLELKWSFSHVNKQKDKVCLCVRGKVFRLFMHWGKTDKGEADLKQHENQNMKMKNKNTNCEQNHTANCIYFSLCWADGKDSTADWRLLLGFGNLVQMALKFLGIWN